MSIYSGNSGVCAMTATTAKTVLNAVAAANLPIKLKAFTVSFDSATATAVPALVELCQSDQGTTGTVGSTPTAVRKSGPVRTVGFTFGANYSAEPATLSAVWACYVPVFNGTFSYVFPLGDEPDCSVSGTTEGLALRVTAPATVNCRASMDIQEG